MTNKERANFLLGNASDSIVSAEHSYGELGNYALAIRRAQEAVELALTAFLAYEGIHYPKDHDQAPLALRVAEKKGYPIDADSGNIQWTSMELSRLRGPVLHDPKLAGSVEIWALIDNANKITKWVEKVINKKTLLESLRIRFKPFLTHENNSLWFNAHPSADETD